MKLKLNNYKELKDGSGQMNVEYDKELFEHAKKWWLENGGRKSTSEYKIINEFVIKLLKEYIEKGEEEDAIYTTGKKSNT